MTTATSSPTFPTPRTEYLPASRFVVDRDIQRGIDTVRVNKLRAEWNPAMVGVLSVSRRDDGGDYLVDGQHRARALVDAGAGDTLVECKVYEGLTPDQESELFYRLNDYLRISPPYKFRARARFGDPVAHDIIEIVEKNGLTIGRDSDGGRIAAVVSLEAVYTGKVVSKNGNYPDILSGTLRILIDAFDKNATTFNGELIKGVGIFLHRHWEKVRLEDVARKIMGHTGGAVGLLAAARAYQSYQGGTVANGVAHAVVTDYNRGRHQSGRLPL